MKGLSFKEGVFDVPAMNDENETESESERRFATPWHNDLKIMINKETHEIKLWVFKWKHTFRAFDKDSSPKTNQEMLCFICERIFMTCRNCYILLDETKPIFNFLCKINDGETFNIHTGFIGQGTQAKNMIEIQSLLLDPIFKYPRIDPK